MIIIHAMNEKVLPRVAATALRERLQVMPAVVVSGARQAGKSTLVQEQVAGRRIYATLDDLDVFDVARRDPMALGGSNPTARCRHGTTSRAGRSTQVTSRMSMTNIWRPSPVCGESMQTVRSSRLSRGWVSTRHSPLYSAGEVKLPRSMRRFFAIW